MLNKYEDWVIRGQEKMCLIIRDLIYAYNKQIFQLLDETDFRTFLEPHLFIFFNSKNKNFSTLEQILFCYIKEKSKTKFNVISDQNGNIYLAGSHVIKTECYSQKLSLYASEKSVVIKDKSNSIVPHQKNKLIKVGDSFFEVISHYDKSLSKYFLNEEGDVTSVKILYTPHLIKLMDKALKIIEAVYPEYYSVLKSVTRKFLLYQGLPNSFATLSAHGIAFLNVPGENGISFFIDNIVHQCGHIIFNAISFEKEKWFKVDPMLPVGEINSDYKADRADLYGRFHGLFTQTNINICIDNCLRSDLLKGEDLLELKARFSSNMKRFKAALNKLDLPEVYTEIGKEWYDFFNSTYNTLYLKRKDMIESYNMDNQPYVFSFKIFKRDNEQPLNDFT